MSRRIIALLTVILMSLLFTVNAFAAEHPPRVVDEADVLSDSEEAALLVKLDELSGKYEVDVAVVTVESLGGVAPSIFANDYFLDNGYGLGNDRNGILLLFSAEVVDGGRDYYVFARGIGYDALEYYFEDVKSAIVGYLRNDDFVQAFDTFASESEYYLDIQINGEPFSFGTSLLVSLGIGFIVALISVSVMKGKLKSVHFKTNAASYQKAGSFKLTDSRDIFLYRTVSKRARPKSNTGGRSGGGGGVRSGGSGGKC